MLLELHTYVEHIRNTYGVDPYLFAVLYLVKVILYWFTVYRIVLSLKKREWEKATSWGILNIFIFLSPYTYVYAVGRNLPSWCGWCYIFLIVLAISSLVLRLHRRLAIRTVDDSR